MFVSEFSFTEKIELAIIILNIYAITILPGGGIIAKYIYVIQILILFFILISRLQYNSLTRNISFKINIFLSIGVVILTLFVISSFIINLSYNLQIKALAKLVTYPILIYIFFFHFSSVIFANDSLFEKFLDFFVVFAVTSAVIALFLFFFDLNFNIEYSYSTIAFLRHPNTFAFFFTFAVPMVMYKYFTKRYNLILTISFLMLFLSCLLFTYSRAGYIGTFITILVLSFKRSKLIFILSTILVLLLFSSFFLGFATSKSDSSVPRIQIMLIAYDMIMNSGLTRLLWGYGIFNNVKVFTNFLSAFGHWEVDPHNFILLLGIQFGMLLTFAVLIAIFYLLIRVMLMGRKGFSFEFNQKINLSFSIVLGILFQDLFEDILVYPEYFVMPIFLVFLGYLYYSVYDFQRKLK